MHVAGHEAVEQTENRPDVYKCQDCGLKSNLVAHFDSVRCR